MRGDGREAMVQVVLTRQGVLPGGRAATGGPRLDFETPKIAGLSDETDVMNVLMVGTAMPAVHAIPFVCAAPPGLTTPAKLPVFGARYAVV
jgi:hypothetical protein